MPQKPAMDAETNPLSLVILFLMLTGGLMAGVLFGIDRGVLSEAFVLLGLFGPALAAILFTLAARESRVSDLLRQYVRTRAPLKVYLVALLSVPVLLLVTQQIAAFLMTDAAWVRFSSLSVPQLIFLPLISIGEELGWRGYLQPRLRQRYSLAVASLVVGVVWALWHLPGYYFNTGVVEGVSFPWFAAWVVSGAVIMGWLYEKSHSVFIAILFHTTVNASFNLIPIMPNDAGSDLPFRIFVLSSALLAAGLMVISAETTGSDSRREPAAIRS